MFCYFSNAKCITTTNNLKLETFLDFINILKKPYHIIVTYGVNLFCTNFSCVELNSRVICLTYFQCHVESEQKLTASIGHFDINSEFCLPFKKGVFKNIFK